MAHDRTVRWAPWTGVGLEHLRIEAGPGGRFTVHSVVSGEDAGRAFALTYYLDIDPDWAFSNIFIARVERGFPSVLLARRDGVWCGEGDVEMPDLRNCIDIDLGFTPFTNTLPIRRLELAAGESREIMVAHLGPPDFTPTPVPQRYTCIEPMKRYRFESLDTGFSAELEVDDDGLVVDYPGLFRRIRGPARM